MGIPIKLWNAPCQQVPFCSFVSVPVSTTVTGNNRSAFCYYRLVWLFREEHVSGVIQNVLWHLATFTYPEVSEIHLWCYMYLSVQSSPRPPEKHSMACTTACLSVLLLIDVWAVSSFWLLEWSSLNIHVQVFVSTNVFISLDKHRVVGLLGHGEKIPFNVTRNQH